MSDSPTLDTALKAETTYQSEDAFAAALRGFGPLGLLPIPLLFAANAILVPLGAVLILGWARLSHTSWSDLGFVKPRSWLRTIAVGIVFGVAFKFLMKVIVMPLLGAPAINQPYHYLVGNGAALPAILYAAIVGAGFGEETIFRGYMFERLGKLFGSSVAAKVSIVLITATLFGLAHYSTQGLPGVEQAAITGLVFGAIFAIRRRIWVLMIAHAAFDLTAIAIIYWNYESVVAHLVFK